MEEQKDEFAATAKKRQGKKEANKCIPREALKNLIHRELESQVKDNFNELMKERNQNFG